MPKVHTEKFYCDRCGAEYNPMALDLANDRIRHASLEYVLIWRKNVSTTNDDASKQGSIILCNDCTQSLIDWWQNEGISTG